MVTSCKTKGMPPCCGEIYPLSRAKNHGDLLEVLLSSHSLSLEKAMMRIIYAHFIDVAYRAAPSDPAQAAEGLCRP